MPAWVGLGVGAQEQRGGLEGGARFHLILKVTSRLAWVSLEVKLLSRSPKFTLG